MKRMTGRLVALGASALVLAGGVIAVETTAANADQIGTATVIPATGDSTTFFSLKTTAQCPADSIFVDITVDHTSSTGGADWNNVNLTTFNDPSAVNPTITTSGFRIEFSLADQSQLNSLPLDAGRYNLHVNCYVDFDNPDRFNTYLDLTGTSYVAEGGSNPTTTTTTTVPTTTTTTTVPTTTTTTTSTTTTTVPTTTTTVPTTTTTTTTVPTTTTTVPTTTTTVPTTTTTVPTTTTTTTRPTTTTTTTTVPTTTTTVPTTTTTTTRPTSTTTTTVPTTTTTVPTTTTTVPTTTTTTTKPSTTTTTQSGHAKKTTTSLKVERVGHDHSGRSVLLAAKVSPKDAAGTVTFYDTTGGETFAVGTVKVKKGAAELKLRGLSGGKHSFQAVFTPADPAAYQGSSSDKVGYGVKPCWVPPRPCCGHWAAG